MSDILTEDLEEQVKKQLKISMGSEISEEDIEHITLLCIEIISIAEYRGKLFSYLTNRMQAIAPNLTHLVGELVGARLIAHAGSLINLAKAPSSTLQILGAEKALFRALKSKSNTPKYGLIYHASLIGQAPAKHKGKIARVLAAKCSISSRVDALGENEKITIGLKSKEKVEDRLKNLDTLSSKKNVSTKIQKLNTSKTFERNTSFPSKLNTKDNYEEKNDVTSNKRKREDEEEKKEVKKQKVEEKKEEKKEVSSSDSSSDSDSSSE
jgi:nucleolar protein 58